MPLLETAAQDLGFAFRTLRKSRGFTAVAVLHHGLRASGCAVFMFSFLNGLLLANGARDARIPHAWARSKPRNVSILRALPRRQPRRLIHRGLHRPRALRRRGRERGHAVPERISGHLVSYEYFSTLGTKPVLGRFFRSGPGAPGRRARGGSERTLSGALRLNADPHAIGRTLRINGQRATIVGVAERDFLGVFPATAADIFVPVTADAAVAPELAGDVLHNAASSVFQVVLRLAPKVTMAAAEAALDAQTRRLDEQSGKRNPNRDKAGSGNTAESWRAASLPIPPRCAPLSSQVGDWS